MPAGRSNVVRSQCRKMVYDVHKYMTKEAQEGPQHDRKQILKRTAAATGVSERTVQRILKAANGSDETAMFRTPGKNRKSRRNITGIDSFDQGAIKRCIQNFHVVENELPTIKTLLRKLQVDINFKGSTTSLRRIIKDLGFKSKKSVDNRRVIIEQTNIRLKRIQYLENITKYLAAGRPIIYTDECYIDPSYTSSKSGVILVHAGSEEGFVPNALMMFTADVKPVNYRSCINFGNYEKWIRTQLIPNLPENSVVVVGNASYHNKLEDAPPTSTSRKSEMESWLTERDIPFNSNMLKPQLYRLIALNKDKFKKYKIDRIFKEHNHTVVHLPPSHPDLNPMEMAWTTIKQYVAEKNFNRNINTVMKFIEEKVMSISTNEWKAYCETVRIIEEEYKKSDVIIDCLTEELVIPVSEDESGDDDEGSSDEEANKDSSSESDPDACNTSILLLMDDDSVEVEADPM